MTLSSGTLAGSGSFRCESCGHELSLAHETDLPTCPGCGHTTWARSSLFTSTIPDLPQAAPPEPWLAEARARVAAPGPHIAYRDGAELICVPLARDWTRVGRSLAADIRFDDPTVSRRHAILARSEDGIRVLDDRSLNGVFVNGERVETRMLRDGDEIVVGRFALAFIDGEGSPDEPAESAESAGASSP